MWRIQTPKNIFKTPICNLLKKTKKFKNQIEKNVVKSIKWIFLNKQLRFRNIL